MTYFIPILTFILLPAVYFMVDLLREFMDGGGVEADTLRLKAANKRNPEGAWAEMPTVLVGHQQNTCVISRSSARPAVLKLNPRIVT